MNKLLKGFFEKLFNSKPESNSQTISPAEVEEIVDARFKELAATIQNASVDQANSQQEKAQDNSSLTVKQIEYAISLIHKVNSEFELAVEPSALTLDDLNKLISYNRYKNKGILVNLVKKGVLRRR